MAVRSPYLLLSAALFLVSTLPCAAQQVSKIPRVGVLGAGAATELPNSAFFDRMRELGYAEGKTVRYERRYAGGRIEDLPDLAKQLAATRPDVIFAPVTPAAIAALKATRQIPIVFAVSADPVGAGLVSSLRQPGGNVTGLMSMNAELAAKRLELLKEAAPRISKIAVFANRDNVPDRQQLEALERVASRMNVVVLPISVRRSEDFARGFEQIRTQSADAVMIIPNPLNIQFRRSILEFAAQGRLPTVDAEDRGARDGALMSYGPSWSANFRQAAELVDRILKGAQPKDLPVEQPTKLELVINLKTAKMLSLTIPPTLKVRADELIE